MERLGAEWMEDPDLLRDTIVILARRLCRARGEEVSEENVIAQIKQAAEDARERQPIFL